MIQKRRLAAIKKPHISIFPDFIADTVSKIDFPRLASMGVKAIFLDLEGTVITGDTLDVNPRIRSALAESGMKIYIATNKPRNQDLKALIRDLGADSAVHPHFIFYKPTKRYFINGLRDKNVEPHETIMIGNRFFQDIVGANRAGMHSLLVLELDEPTGYFGRILSRLEKRLTLHIARHYDEY